MKDYSTKYTLSSVHNDSGNDEVITHSFDATNATLGEVLEKIETFLIAVGFDWIKKGEIQHVESVTDEDYDSNVGAELFDEYSMNAEEMYNRLNGLDNTAKIVEFPQKVKSEDTITLTTGSGEYDIGSITFDGMDITDGMNFTLDTSDVSFSQQYNVSLTPDDVTFKFTNPENKKEKD